MSDDAAPHAPTRATLAGNGRDNGFGALRLLLAAAVIVSHGFEQVDGDPHREPLTVLYGGMTIGTVAVLWFFMITGYLIASSFMADANGYLPKRILRIYPGFVVAAALCVFVVAPLAGGTLRSLSIGESIELAGGTLMLQAPDVPGAFAGLPEAALNGSMWTICYEFRCYLLAAGFGLLGLYLRPRLFVVLTAAVVAANLLFLSPGVERALALPGPLEAAIGQPKLTVRLLSAFMVGTCFWLLRPALRGRTALAVAVLLPIGLVLRDLHTVTIITLGGYLLFWIALRCPWPPLRRINATTDVSYGVYLYAFPITQLLILYQRNVNVGVLIAETFVLALLCGAVSWRLVEQPALMLRRRLHLRRRSRGVTLADATPGSRPEVGPRM